jgi:hypothetical protein
LFPRDSKGGKVGHVQAARAPKVPFMLPVVLTFTAVTALQSVAARADDAGSDASGPGDGGSDAAVDATPLFDAGPDGDSGDAGGYATPASCEAQGGKWEQATGCGGSTCVLPDGRRIQGLYFGMNLGAGCC